MNTKGTFLLVVHHNGVDVSTEKVKRGPEQVDVAPLSNEGREGGLLQSNHLQPISVGGTAHRTNFHMRKPNRIQHGLEGRMLTDGTGWGGDHVSTGYNPFLTSNYLAEKKSTRAIPISL